MTALDALVSVGGALYHGAIKPAATALVSSAVKAGAAGYEVLSDANATEQVRANVHTHVKAAAKHLHSATGHLHSKLKTGSSAAAKHIITVAGVPEAVAEDVQADLSVSLYAAALGLAALLCVVLVWLCVRRCASGCDRHDRRPGAARYKPVGARATVPQGEEDDDANFDDLMEQVLRDARREEERVQLEGELEEAPPQADKRVYQL